MPIGAERLAHAPCSALELGLLSCCSTRPDSLRHREQAQLWTSGVESHSRGPASQEDADALAGADDQGKAVIER